jgi:hypothetical protein
MIWVPALKAYLHLLPVTKVQFEYFLCDTTDPRFGAEMYEEVLADNPRISPGQVRGDNYFQAFLTGLRAGEGQAFADWCGQDRDELYELPTVDEWYRAYDEFKGRPALALDEVLQLGLAPRAETLVRRLERAAEPLQAQRGGRRDLADSLYLRQGIFEWVRGPDDRWGGAGLPHARFTPGIINLDAHEPRWPKNDDTRHRGFGCRLLKRGL